ncbi:uncharacterized protein LOC115775715 isoform X2 [Archocentrus centrarchus]|uniref:uncharacterized protein LOC115775715 isoform X2 n=1 Tax=Archocentrus centrarchus TaxID=63155 RepID=UPI0011E9C0A7|nr:uncharacterized protein LOC115775715 isoform X2 [Archocentrus centrarchus]
MRTAKGKGGSACHRYRPASEYDDATLALKREYWRNKKREQRARLSERRGRPKHNSSRGEKQLSAPAGDISSLSRSSGALSSPLQTNDDSCNSVSKHGDALGDASVETTESQKEKWLQTIKLNKLLPQLRTSCSFSAKSAGGNTATGKCQTERDALHRTVSSPTSSGPQLNTTSSVPPIRVTRITNGSSTKTAPQPCVSMQGASVPKSQRKAQVVLPIQPKVLPTGLILASSPRGPISIKAESKTAMTTPQSGTQSALVTTQRAKGVGNAQPSLESDEERAAKRREQWRIKKREQRAKLAARLAKARERTQGAEMTFQRLAPPKTGLVGSVAPPSQPVLRGQKQCRNRVKTSLGSSKSENNKLQSGATTVAVTTPQTSGTASVKKPADSQRKLPGHSHLFSVTRGIARCRTSRQRFIEVQKGFMNQRGLRCKSQMLGSAFGTRSMPKINPDNTPEQIVAKRREYWRIKKREQRAKLSMEVKVRLKERDSLMRRVKRYQKILEEMRKTRVLTHSTGSALAHASETIGGFIKEDGTVTANIPQTSADHSTAEDKREEASTNPPLTEQQHRPDAKLRGIASIRMNRAPPQLCLAQVKVSIPLPGQPVNKPPRLLTVRPQAQLESTTVPHLHSLAVQTVGQLTLTHPQSPQNTASEGSAGSNLSGCVMKMTVSSSAPSLSALSLDTGLTEEERMAKKREYWRIKKREQRAARAVRLRQGVLHARANAALQRRKAQKVSVTTLPQSRSLTDYTGNAPPLPNSSVPFLQHANEIKQESESMPPADLNPRPEQAICPDIKPPTSPPPAPQPESDPPLSADSQAATLLAVASMKKLLEESLSTVTECKSEQDFIKIETTEEASQQDMKPNLPQLAFERDDMAPIAADLTLQIQSWQPDSKVSLKASLQNHQLKSSPQVDEPLPPLPACSEAGVHPTCEHSSQTPLNYIVNTSMEAPRRTQRLCAKKAGYKTCCSPEPPKLHHITAAAPDNLQQQQQQQQCEHQHQAQEHNNCFESTQRCSSVATVQSGLTSLQRKREYWKLMKRQQRAKLKARQKEGEGECSSRLSPRSIQAPGLVIPNSLKGASPPAKRALQPKLSVTSLDSTSSIPTVLVVSQTTCNAHQSACTLQVRPPITSREQSSIKLGPPHVVSSCAGACESPQLSQSCRSTDSAPILSIVKPPNNPLSSIDMQTVEPLGQSPIKIPSAPTHKIQSPSQLAPVSTMAPPKPIPGEAEQDFLRRKREYWRIKKKEQRARKAVQDKGITPVRASNNWKAILPPLDLQTDESGHWVNSSEESERLMSASADTDSGSFTYSDYTAPIEGEMSQNFCLPNVTTIPSLMLCGGAATSWTMTLSTSCWCAWCVGSCSTPTAWRE